MIDVINKTIPKKIYKNTKEIKEIEENNVKEENIISRLEEIDTFRNITQSLNEEEENDIKLTESMKPIKNLITKKATLKSNYNTTNFRANKTSDGFTIKKTTIIKEQENTINTSDKKVIKNNKINITTNNHANTVNKIKREILKLDQKENKLSETVNNLKIKNTILKIIPNNTLNNTLNSYKDKPLNKEINKVNKVRPKSTYKKPDIESKLNEASLSTEASVFRGRIEDYAVGKEIGKGAYAVVKQALHKPTNKKMAVKIYEKIKLLDPQRKNSVKREIQILKKIEHHNIIKLHEVIETSKQTMLIMELVQGVSLLTFLKSKQDRRLEENECRHVFSQIVKGIAYCHSKNICHRDVKLENVIVEENKAIKLIDFGFGTVSTSYSFLNFFCGTPSYMPPEIVQKKDYIGQSADVWSLGILMYTLLCGAFPFRALNEKELYCKIVKGVYNFPDHISSNAGELVKKILNLNPTDRPSADEILRDKWFHNLNIISEEELLVNEVDIDKDIDLDFNKSSSKPCLTFHKINSDEDRTLTIYNTDNAEKLETDNIEKLETDNADKLETDNYEC